MRNYWLIFLLVISWSACQKEEDTERPFVIIDSPVEGALVETQGGLLLEATLGDNSGLLQFKLVLNGIDSANGVAADSTYSIIFIDALPDQKNYILQQQFDLPDSTFNGFYYVVLSCLDIEGNESIKDTVRFQIANSIDSEPPQFNVTGPEDSDTLNFGQGFTVLGSTTDSQSLIYSDIYVGRTDGSDTVLYFTFPEPVNNTIDFTSIGWYLQADSSWSEGAYHMYITSWDNYSGASYEVPFYVFY